MGAFTHVRVLVDWNNIQARVAQDFHRNPRANIPSLILRIQQQTSRALMQVNSTAKYRAALRIYHGWHAKRDATPMRQDFERFRFDSGFARRIGPVSYMAGFEFGNELCCYDEAVPLYDTYRGNGQGEGQKMVDTAISCDVLHLSRSFPELVSVVVSDDDDFLPAVITAKKWRTKSLLIRVEERDLTSITDDSLGGLVYYWSEN